MKNSYALLFIIILSFSCNLQNPEQSEENKDGIHEVIVKDFAQTKQYTYLLVEENDDERWLATRKMEVKKGETYYYQGGMIMKDFKSKELSMNFDQVVFLERVVKSPKELKTKRTMSSPHTMGNKIKVVKSETKVEPAPDGITVAELYANKKKYEGEKVKIRAEVVKFNKDIMKKNWIHIQDGTEHEGKYDLVVTSQDFFKVGEVVTLEGKVFLDQDFGHGYAYELLMNNAVKK